ncbi:MAG: tRNA-dihydrouridine synthase family protein [Oligoflexia bacterium]|nr:tRNA-dihydrouridine synthase family protein [Oligoflexia bacterium]
MDRSYQLRHLSIAPALVLAPMSGVTCSPFRRLIKELNPGHVGLVVSEFISVEGLTRQSQRSRDMMRFHENERPYGVQIFGYDVDRMRDAALMVQDCGADLVDINCGCPAPKVVKRGGGCELMRQPEHLQKIIAAVRKAVSIPLTLKMRSGWCEESQNALEIARMCEQEGVEALAIHGRTRAQLYRGLADWSVVERIAEQVSIPVLGSGDVCDRASAETRLRGKIAGLFIGRAAMENPFVFSVVRGQAVPDLRRSPALVLNVLWRYIELLREEFPDRAVVGRFKQLVTQMCRGYDWRKDICRASTLAEQLDIIQGVRARLEDRNYSVSSVAGCVTSC